MIWFNELLRGPAAKSPEHPAAAAPSAVDPDTARAALAAANDEEQQRRHAEALGCALAALQKAPLPADGPGVWAAAISHLADKSIALQWIEHLNGDGWLGEVAASGRFAEVRLAAAQRIEDRAVLRQLSHLSRGKDKAVFRHCSDVLRKDRQAAGRAQRAAQLAADLRDLLDHAPLSVSCLLDLQRELHALGNGSEAPLPECSVLLEQAEARLRQESEARRALQACRAEAAELLAQCTAAGPTRAAEQLDGWRDRLSGLAQVHTGLPPWLAGKAAHQALESLLRQLESRLTALASEPEQAAAPEPPAPAIEIAATPEPAAKPPVDLAAVRALLERMEQALEQGHLGEADAAAKQIKATVAGGALHGNLAARLQRTQARLAELSDWAKWGAQKKREQLIAAAQSLLAGSHEVEHLARAVPALREEWKQVTGQTAPTQGEWGRFDAALEKAYRPVAARHAEEAARRSKARADKEALCAEWEAAAAAIDWERADYTAVEAQRQQVLDRWRGAPLAGFRDERALRKRLEKTLGEVDQRLAAARAAEIGRREELIAVAEALREAPDLRSAISETRTLQQRWRDEVGPLRLTRFDEQKLWRRFRAACDAVFARRDAERAEQVVQREKRAQTRATLLDGFAAAWAGMDASQLKRALAQFRSDWDGTRTGRAEGTDALDQRARAQQQQAQRRIDELQRHAYRDRLERMAQQAAPAADLDAEALAAGRKERELLLIDLEIALDLPTPEAFAQARRRRQLERLQVRFRGDRPQQPRAEDLLARLYAAPAGPDAEMDARLAAVVGRLIEQGTAAAR
jgi:hypothetical protein